MRKILSLGLLAILLLAIFILPGYVSAAEKIYNCGYSKVLSTDVVSVTSDANKQKELETKLTKDKPLICLGNKILAGCQKAKVTFKDAEAGIMSYIIDGKNGDNCNVKIQYGSAAQIKKKSERIYANTYLQCPVPFAATTSSDEAKAKPGLLAASYFVVAEFQLVFQMLGEALAGQQSTQTEVMCSGTTLDMYRNPKTKDKDLQKCYNLGKGSIGTNDNISECFANLALKRKRSALCQEIAWGQYTPACYAKLAVKQKKPNLCKTGLAGTFYTDSDRDSCYSKYIELKKGKYTKTDIATCKLLKNSYSQGDCIEEIAKQFKDINICNEIKTSDVSFCKSGVESLIAQEATSKLVIKNLEYVSAKSTATEAVFRAEIENWSNKVSGNIKWIIDGNEVYDNSTSLRYCPGLDKSNWNEDGAATGHCFYEYKWQTPIPGQHSLQASIKVKDDLTINKTVDVTVEDKGQAQNLKQSVIDLSAGKYLYVFKNHDPNKAGQYDIEAYPYGNIFSYTAIPAIAFHAVLKIDDIQVDDQVLSTVKGYINYLVTKPLTPGKHKFELILDSTNQVVEFDETNNTSTQEYEVD